MLRENLSETGGILLKLDGAYRLEEHVLPPCADKGLRHGKAPPIDSFTREEADLRLEDWLPNLERAFSWS